jgi:hypothetical protein
LARSWITIGAVFGLSVGILGLGALSLYAEISPYFTRGVTIQEKHVSISARTAQPGWSSYSKAVFMADCLAVVQSPVSIVQRANDRQALLTACRDIARNAAVEMPSNGQAWLVGAALAAQAGDVQELNRMLDEGRRTTPFVHWLAAARINLSEANYEFLDERSRAAELADFQVLLDSEVGIKSLALTYVGRPESRERITSVVERASAATQRSFLAQVRRTLTQ